jgi:hypothetical protein
MRIHTLLLLAGMTVGVHAQWLNIRESGIPRTKDGKANLSAPAPRGSGGKPDLSGVWQPEGAAKEDLVKLMPPDGINGLGEDDPPLAFFNVLADFKPEEMPMWPEVAAEYKKVAAVALTTPPPALCVPPAMPIVDSFGPFKIVQTPKLMLILFEPDTFFRQIFLDGRKHPDNPQVSWLGYSTGRWEGDSLIVETVGLKEAPLDVFQHPHSEAMRVTERFRRRDFGHMDLQITIDDPETYTKPFTYKINLRRLPDTDLLESFCVENETDLAHMKKQ